MKGEVKKVRIDLLKFDLKVTNENQIKEILSFKDLGDGFKRIGNHIFVPIFIIEETHICPYLLDSKGIPVTNKAKQIKTTLSSYSIIKKDTRIVFCNSFRINVMEFFVGVASIQYDEDVIDNLRAILLGEGVDLTDYDLPVTSEKYMNVLSGMNEIISLYEKNYENEKIVMLDKTVEIKKEMGEVGYTNIKTTIKGKTAVQSNDGFYYSVDENGKMTREYSTMENFQEMRVIQKPSLNVGDIIELDGQYLFCSQKTEQQYSLTSFSDKSVRQIHRSDENDDLAEQFFVIINPITSILENDPNATPASLLANNPNNANRLNLDLQIQQNNMLNNLAKMIVNMLGENDE